MAWIEGRLSTRGTGSGAITVAAALGALAACWALVGRVKSKSEKTVSFTLANLQTLRGFELREILKDEVRKYACSPVQCPFHRSTAVAFRLHVQRAGKHRQADVARL